LPGMVERHAGRIVNIASIGGKVSVPHLLSYSTAKFAVVGFSEGLRAELLREGIHVTTVCPGLMRTGSYLNAQFKGAPDTEVTLFSLLDNIPLISISAERAARQIVAATLRGAPELIISAPAVAATTFHGLFPGLTADLLGLVDSALPGRPEPGNRLLHGSEQQTSVTRSPLLALGHAAARRLNQRHAIAQRDGAQTAETVTSNGV
ncbi:MAG TPA: SDR family NAD(P)-dependent oxidoreductase, partial [Ktedonobacterales bacterium]|nr:SDR family NAD(P)-dependent oxidoreductase [Ktedonobacterales bacterium]